LRPFYVKNAAHYRRINRVIDQEPDATVCFFMLITYY
jgi:hypothetical protein